MRLSDILESCQHTITNTPPTLVEVEEALEQTGARLELEDEHLYLQHDRLRLSINFSQGDYAHRKHFGGGRQQHLAKAVGLHKKKTLTIVDATAGLGKDSFVLANLGANIRMIERSPVLVLMLAYALASYSSELSMQLYYGDTRTILSSLRNIDVIYLDPMYPESDSDALPKKGAQILRVLAYRDDLEEEGLLELARQHAPKTVVKRPKGAVYLANIAPQQELKAKNTRYDLYL